MQYIYRQTTILRTGVTFDVSHLDGQLHAIATWSVDGYSYSVTMTFPFIGFGADYSQAPVTFTNPVPRPAWGSGETRGTIDERESKRVLNELTRSFLAKMFRIIAPLIRSY